MPQNPTNQSYWVPHEPNLDIQLTTLLTIKIDDSVTPTFLMFNKLE